MQLTYHSDFDELLDYQLYIASENKSLMRRRKVAHLLFPILYIPIGIFGMLNQRYIFGGVMLLIALIWLIGYPIYARYRYRKFYVKHLQTVYGNTIGNEIHVEFLEEYIVAKSNGEETKLPYENFVALIETPRLFLLKINAQRHLVIPTSTNITAQQLREWMQQPNLHYVDKRDWVWK